MRNRHRLARTRPTQTRSATATTPCHALRAPTSSTPRMTLCSPPRLHSRSLACPLACSYPHSLAHSYAHSRARSSPAHSLARSPANRAFSPSCVDPPARQPRPPRRRRPHKLCPG
eukprot:3770272-Pleurochrysis_carterae.AAC.1